MPHKISKCYIFIVQSFLEQVIPKLNKLYFFKGGEAISLYQTIWRQYKKFNYGYNLLMNRVIKILDVKIIKLIQQHIK